MKKVFLAMPVSDNLDSRGEFRPERRKLFGSVVDVLAGLGLEVLSAGTHEDWGRIRLTPKEFTAYDIESLMQCDLLVVVTNERLNRDMYLETGIAVARRVPILFFVPASTKLTYMGLGMEELGLITVSKYDAESELPSLVEAVVGRALEELADEAKAADR